MQLKGYMIHPEFVSEHTKTKLSNWKNMSSFNLLFKKGKNMA